MNARAKKWWLIGGGVWVMCGVVPSVITISEPQTAFVFYSIAGGLGVLSALLISPQPRRWAWGAITLLWCFGWFLWQRWIWIPAGHIVDGLIHAGAISSSNGPTGNLGDAFMAMIILSSLITTLLLVGVTRSGWVCGLTLIPPALYLVDWLLGLHIPLSDRLWHAMIIGALMIWAVPRRVRPFPTHRCQSCGYDLRGLEFGAKCPECGAAATITSAAG